MDVVRRRTAENGQTTLPGMELAAAEQVPVSHEPESWIDRVQDALGARSGDALAIAEEAVRHCPGEPELLLLAALAALSQDLPDRCLAFIKRYRKRYKEGKADILLSALALAQRGQILGARALLRRHDLAATGEAARWFVGGYRMFAWLRDRMARIRGDGQDRKSVV